jgi:UDP-N-acetylglucosamine 1-carboxyvinyltransferase
MIAAAATGGCVKLTNVIPKHLESISAKLEETGAIVEEFDDAVVVTGRDTIRKANVKTHPYPGFPTDMQAQICVCMVLASGISRLTENVYETRFFGYCTELEHMGARIQVDGKTASVAGVEKLRGATVRAKDLRAGAALIIAGLTAEGTTRVENIHYVERGYERLIEKFTALGADIRRVED